jgi:hypothetical protein
MSTRFIISMVGVMCGSLCGIGLSFTIFEMVDKVNGQLPAEQRFSRLGSYWFKYQRLKREYRRLYPYGRLVRRVRTLRILFLTCFFMAVLASFGH